MTNTLPRRNKVVTGAEGHRPLLQWASGRNEGRTTPGKGMFNRFAGFYSETGKHEALDAACARAGIAQVEMRHPREGGKSEEILHWNLGSELVLYPLSMGPLSNTLAGSLAGKNAYLTAEAGIGACWKPGEKSRLQLTVLVAPLVAVGYLEPLLLVGKSTITDYILAALSDHMRVVEKADGLIDRKLHPEEVLPWEIGWPLVMGNEVAAGKRESTMIVVMESGHPQELDKAYIKGLYRPKEVHERCLALWPDVVSEAHAFQVAAEEDEGEQAPQASGVYGDDGFSAGGFPAPPQAPRAAAPTPAATAPRANAAPSLEQAKARVKAAALAAGEEAPASLAQVNALGEKYGLHTIKNAAGMTLEHLDALAGRLESRATALAKAQRVQEPAAPAVSAAYRALQARMDREDPDEVLADALEQFQREELSETEYYALVALNAEKTVVGV